MDLALYLARVRSSDLLAGVAEAVQVWWEMTCGQAYRSNYLEQRATWPKLMQFPEPKPPAAARWAWPPGFASQCGLAPPRHRRPRNRRCSFACLRVAQTLCWASLLTVELSGARADVW